MTLYYSMLLVSYHKYIYIIVINCLSTPVLCVEVIIWIFAGQETTGNLLSFAIATVHQHPHILDRSVYYSVFNTMYRRDSRPVL